MPNKRITVQSLGGLDLCFGASAQYAGVKYQEYVEV